jgi:very-short-patch-repair endonuclease
VAQTLLDFAASEPIEAVRQVLAEADYRRLLNVAAVTGLIGQGRPGSVTLRKALTRHQPRLAFTRSELERRFIRLCEEAELPVPELNRRVSRMRIDALWREQKLAVELDGQQGHGSKGQSERDRRRDLRLRAYGFTVVRYTASQVFDEPHLVAEDLRLLLSRPARSA